MKTATAEYRNSMAGLLRNRSYVKVTVSEVDVDAAWDGTITDTGHCDWSENVTLNYDYEYGRTVATLEKNRWTLDGNTKVVPWDEPANDGWISSLYTDAAGELPSSVVLTRTFTEAHDFLGLSFIFDSRTQEWPVSFVLTLFNGDTVLETRTVYPDGAFVEVSGPFDGVTKFTIAWGNGLPQRRPRLERIIYGITKTFTGEEIVSTEQAHDIDPLARRLPSETLKFTILDYENEYDPDNPEGVYRYIDANSPVKIAHGYELDDGRVEWLVGDSYSLNGKPETKDHKATFSAVGLLGTMNANYYKGAHGNKSFYDMAVAVLQDAGLRPVAEGVDAWLIDDSLRDLYTTAVLPIATHKNCLQLIAHACCCRLFTDDQNVIHIEPFDLTTIDNEPYVLDFDTVIDRTQALSKIDTLKEIAVSKAVYASEGDSTVIYTETTTKEALHVEFGGLKDNVAITVTGGTVISSNIYGRAADIVLSSGTKTVRITGRNVSESTVILSYPVANEGAVDQETNPLITSDTMADALAAHVQAWLQYRSTYDLQYRGDPVLETGDKVELQTQYSEALDGLVLTNNLTFNGALRGAVKVKALT